MKKLLFIAGGLVLCTAKVLFGQNLVPNPSFEEYDTCPAYDSQLRYASGWTINVNTADYFNTCANTQAIPDVGVPMNAWGYQQPATGDAYAGFYAHSYVTGSSEFLGGELLLPLEVGNKYYVFLKVSLSDAQPHLTHLMCGVDKIGILFTNRHFGDTVMLPPPFLSNHAHFYFDNIISDTLGWFEVKGSFIADSVYRYFIIGHFFDVLNTSFECLDSNNVNFRYSYYYIDDVCISPDSSICALNVNTLKIPKNEALAIYPNPTGNFINVSTQSNCFEIVISNTLGEILLQSKLISDNKSIDVSEFSNGIYFLSIKTTESISILKFIIQR